MRFNLQALSFRLSPQAVRLLVVAGFVLAAVAISGQALFQAVVAVSGPRRFSSFQFSLLATIGPALLFYSSLTCAVALIQGWRGSTATAAVAAWESVAWGLVGAAIHIARGEPRNALGVAFVLVAALLLERRAHWQQRVYRLYLELVGWAVALAMLVPLLWMLVASLRPATLTLPTRLEWWPSAISLSSYTLLGELLPLWRYLANSLLVVVIAVPLALLVASAAGFGLVHLPVSLRQPLLVLSVVALAMPPMALWLTRFLVFRWLGLLNTPVVLLAPALLGGSPLCVLLFYLAFRRLPTALWDQSRIDGATPLQTWWLIGLPQVQAMLVALGALVFGLFWGNYIDPLLYLSSNRWQTLPVGLQALQQLTPSNWSVLLAGAVVMTLPGIVVFMLAQRALLGVGIRAPHR